MMPPRIGKAPQQFNKRTTVHQACKAEQWHGIKAPRSTHVTNIFYGVQGTYRGWDKDAWALDKHHSNYNMLETDSLIGMLATRIGRLFDALGIGKKKSNTEAGEPATPPTQPTQPTQPTVEEEEEEEKIHNPWDEKNLSITAMDEEVNGKSPTENIVGTVGSVKQNDDNLKFPESFTITTSKGNKYTFELVAGKYYDNKAEQPIYKCTNSTEGGNEKKYAKGNEYALVFNESGKPEKLVQYQSMAGHGVNVGELKDNNKGTCQFYKEDGSQYTEASS